MVKNKSIAVIFLVCGFFLSSVSAITYDSIYWAPPLDVQGTNIINAKGYILQLKGFATMGAYPDVKKEQIVRFRNDWKITLLRLPLLTGDCNCPRAVCWPIGSKTPSAAYIAAADSVIKWCRDNHIYVLLDGWHEGGQGNTVGNFGTTIAAWRFLADRYKDQDHIIWELFNEPHNVSWTALAPMMEQLIDTIRSKNPVSKVIVTGTANWDQQADVKTRKIEREKIVYSWHPYWNVYESNDATAWESHFGYIVTSGIAPVMNTEWGFDGGNVPYGTRLTDYCKEKGISWTGWIYSSDWGPTMLSSVNPEVRNAAGNFMYKACHDTVPVNHIVDVKKTAGQPVFGGNFSINNSTIRFFCTETSPVTLSIYAVDGRYVGTPIEQMFSKGDHWVRWKGIKSSIPAVAQGLYLFHLQIKGRNYFGQLNVLR